MFMLAIECCGCGVALPERVRDCIIEEFKRRGEEAEEGFAIPPIYQLCPICEADALKFIEEVRNKPS